MAVAFWSSGPLPCKSMSRPLPRPEPPAAETSRTGVGSIFLNKYLPKNVYINTYACCMSASMYIPAYVLPYHVGRYESFVAFIH